MISKKYFFSFLPMLFVCVSCMQEDTAEPIVSQLVTALSPEITLIYNANIYTMDQGSTTADTLVFDAKGKIVFVGQGSDLPQETLFAANKIDLQGKSIIPGLIDAHAHLYGLALSLSQAQLQGTSSKHEVIVALQDHAKNLSAGEWLLGRGWDQNDWLVQEFPDITDLDEAFPDRPVWLKRIDGHAGWANSAALAMADQRLSGNWQPTGGQIYRDKLQQPTGILIDAAMELVEKAVPEISPELLELSLDLAIHKMISVGLTGVHDPGVNQQIIALYQQKIALGKFPIRVYAMTDGAGKTLSWLCERGALRDASGRLFMRSVKLYVDGALGSRGAALHSDYSDDHGNSGLLFMPPEKLAEMVDKAAVCGFQVGIHAIGDKGNAIALNALETAITRYPNNPGRHRVEHAQVLTKHDILRFSPLGIIAAVQPTHATSDMYWAENRLGPDRVKYAYSWRSLLDSGARLALGSDFPVEDVNPMLGIYAAVTRQDTTGWPEGGWYPEQILTREEALRGFTLDAAYAGFMEDMVGSLEPGKKADFIVLDRDVMRVAADEIPSIKVLQTWLDGELIWQR